MVRPDHAGDVIAIVVQFLKRLDMADLEIRADTADHIVEIFVRDAVARDRIGERRPQRVLRRVLGSAAGEGRIEIGLPSRDGSGAVADAFRVTEIVAVAHERVNRAHGLALRPGEQEEGVVEVFGLGARHALAEGVGLRDGHGFQAARENARRVRAPSSSPTRSTLEMAGRDPRTS